MQRDRFTRLDRRGWLTETEVPGQRTMMAGEGSEAASRTPDRSSAGFNSDRLEGSAKKQN